MPTRKRRKIIPLYTQISLDVREKDLPVPPKSYYWYVKTQAYRKFKIHYEKRRVRKYYYTWVESPTLTSRYVYTVRGNRRKRIYLRRTRIYYTAIVTYRIKIPSKKIYYRKVWVLRKPRIKREDWRHLSEIYALLKAKYEGEELVFEEEPPFPFVEMNTRFCSSFARLSYVKYFFVYLYILAKIPKESPDTDEYKYVLGCRAFRLRVPMNVYELSYKEIPRLIAIIEEDMQRKSGLVSLAEFVCYTTVAVKDVYPMGEKSRMKAIAHKKAQKKYRRKVRKIIHRRRRLHRRRRSIDEIESGYLDE